MPSSRRLPFFPLPQPLSHFSGSIVASLCGSPFARATFYSFGEDDFITFALKKWLLFAPRLPFRLLYSDIKACASLMSTAFIFVFVRACTAVMVNCIFISRSPSRWLPVPALIVFQRRILSASSASGRWENPKQEPELLMCTSISIYEWKYVKRYNDWTKPQMKLAVNFSFLFSLHTRINKY